MPGSTVSAAGLRVVKLLVGTPPQTVTDLIKATGVTRTAVTEQLNELVAGGYVERTLERLPGRGRPRHLYRATHAALLLLFAGNQNLVVPAIWRALGEVGGRDLVRKVIQHVSQTVADHYCRRLTAREPAERLKQVAELLRQEGGLLDLKKTPDGSLVLHKRSCAFISMYDPSGSICEVDEDFLSRVVGSPVRRVGCRHAGDPCCSFEIAAPSGNGAL